jgi:peroxiredoxin
MMVQPAVAGALERAPEFTLKDLSGKTVSLSQQKGKVVFLDFWASWCPPCRRSIPEVEKLHEIMGSRGDVVVLGINIEGNPGKARTFAAEKGMKYPVLIGDEKTARNYRVNGIPAFFIINQEGQIVRSYSGHRPGMEAEWESVITGLLKSAPEKTPRQPLRK